jgi:hypothetical protein
VEVRAWARVEVRAWAGIQAQEEEQLAVLWFYDGLLALSCLGVRAARCVVAAGVPLERRGSRAWESLDLTRMHGSGKPMRVLQADCRGWSRDKGRTRSPWCKEWKHHPVRGPRRRAPKQPCVVTDH